MVYTKEQRRKQDELRAEMRERIADAYDIEPIVAELILNIVDCVGCVIRGEKDKSYLKGLCDEVSRKPGENPEGLQKIIDVVSESIFDDMTGVDVL